MKKFNVKQPEYAFFLFNKSHYRLFQIGWSDINISKKGSGEYYCSQSSFDYEGNQNTLCGKEGYGNPFEIKQFTVIQMK